MVQTRMSVFKNIVSTVGWLCPPVEHSNPRRTPPPMARCLRASWLEGSLPLTEETRAGTVSQYTVTEKVFHHRRIGDWPKFLGLAVGGWLLKIAYPPLLQ